MLTEHDDISAVLKAAERLGYELSEEDGLSADEKSLEDAVIQSEEKRKIHEAIKTLPQDMQAAIHLIYFEDMSYNNVAKILGKNTKQIDNLLYRAKGKLRTILGEDGEQLL